MEQTSKPAPQTEAQPHKVAVIGCGHWGKNLVRNFHQLGALSAISDAHEETAQRIGGEYGVPNQGFSEILNDPEIAAVVIAAPAEQHAQLCREALLAGKHVYVEKPLALDVADAEELAALAEKQGRVLMVGHLLQYHPAFNKLKEMVRGGELGRLEYIYSNRLNLGKVRREENILWSFAPHDISMILSLTGDLPESVTAVGSCYLHKTISDVTVTHLRFPGGENAHIFVSWLHPFKEQKLIVVGEKAMVVFNDGEPWESKLTLYPHRIDWVGGVPQPNKAEGSPVPVEASEPLKLECGHFLECVATGQKPRTDGREGIAVLSVLQAAEMSMSSGAEVPLREVIRKAPAAVAEKSQAPAGTKRPGVMVHESAYVDDPCEIGEGTKIWHFSHILKGTRIGRNASIGQNVMIGPNVTVGDNCKIQNNVSLYDGVTLEDGVFCGPSCVFTNVNNPRAEVERKSEFRPTLVKRGASIGANATIVCGHTLGAYAFIAAGAVVAHDVPDHALMAGVPARRIGWMSHAGEKLGPDLVCPREGRRYRETPNGTLEEITP